MASRLYSIVPATERLSAEYADQGGGCKHRARPISARTRLARVSAFGRVTLRGKKGAKINQIHNQIYALIAFL